MSQILVTKLIDGDTPVPGLIAHGFETTEQAVKFLLDPYDTENESIRHITKMKKIEVMIDRFEAEITGFSGTQEENQHVTRCLDQMVSTVGLLRHQLAMLTYFDEPAPF